MALNPIKGAGLGASIVAPRCNIQRVLYSEDVSALLTRMGGSPDPTLAQQINTSYNNLDSIIAKMDGFWVFGLHAQQASLTNWAAEDSMTVSGSPVFIAHDGWTGVTNSDYLNSGKSVDGVNFTQNSASIGIWIRDDYSAASIYPFGTADGLLRMTPKAGTGNINGRMNSSTNMGNIAVATAAGMTTFNRSGASATQTYKDDVQVGTGVTVSGNGTGNVEFLHDPNTGNPFPQTLYAAFMGASLTAGEVEAIYAELSALKAVTDELAA